MNKNYLAGAVGAMLLLVSAGTAAAQVPMSSRAMGMGGAYIGAARGQEALFQNPANLGLPGTSHWSVALPQVAVGATALGFSLEELPDFLDTGGLSESERSDLLGRIPQTGTELGVDVRLPALVLQNRRFAFGVAYTTRGEHTIGRDLVDLAVNGYEQGRTDYSVGNTAGNRATYLDFAAGYGRNLGRVSVGATAHYYRGMGLTRTRLFNPTYSVEAEDISIEYAGVQKSSGNGWGVDLGAAMQPTPELTVSAVVRNVLGSMSWTDDVTFRTLTLDSEDFQPNYDAVRSLQIRYDRSKSPLAEAPAHVSALAVGMEENMEVPTSVEAGVAWQPLGGTVLGASYRSTVSDGLLNGRWDSMMSAGIQQKLPLVTLRAGYATDAADANLLSGGVSLGPIHLGLARFENGSVGSAERSGWIATFALGTGSNSTMN